MKKNRFMKLLIAFVALFALVGTSFGIVNAKRGHVSRVRSHKKGTKSHPRKIKNRAHKQHGQALSSYKVKNFHVVNNGNYSGKHFTGDDNFHYVAGNANPNTSFNEFANLSSDLADPQSIAIVGNVAYIMNSDYGDSAQVVKYDLNKHQIIQKGPWFKGSGHGQSLAYNPRNHQMWFVSRPAINAQVRRLNMNSLTPDKTVNFKLSSTVKMGEQLAFSNDGKAYFDTYSYGGWAPKGSVKIYEGKISSKRVHFHLVMRGIRHNPGNPEQGLGYNPANNNLYFVSDGAVMRVPVNNLHHLKASNIRTVVATLSQEYEGIAFQSNGQGYLLANNPYGLKKLNNSNF